MKEREPLSWSHPVGSTWWPRSLVGWSAIRVDAHRWVSRPTVRHTRSGPTATSSFDALVQAAFPGGPLDTAALSSDFPLSDFCRAASRDPAGPRSAVRHQARAAPGDLIHPSATPSASDAIGRRDPFVVRPDPGGRDRLVGIRAPSRGSCGCDIRRQSASTRSDRKNDDDSAGARAGNCLRAKRPSTIPVRYVCTGTAVGIVGLGPTRREAASGRTHRRFQSRLRTPHGNIIT
jgi:hypothetical protein